MKLKGTIMSIILIRNDRNVLYWLIREFQKRIPRFKPQSVDGTLLGFAYKDLQSFLGEGGNSSIVRKKLKKISSEQPKELQTRPAPSRCLESPFSVPQPPGVDVLSSDHISCQLRSIEYWSDVNPQAGKFSRHQVWNPQRFRPEAFFITLSEFRGKGSMVLYASAMIFFPEYPFQYTDDIVRLFIYLTLLNKPVSCEGV